MLAARRDVYDMYVANAYGTLGGVFAQAQAVTWRFEGGELIRIGVTTPVRLSLQVVKLAIFRYSHYENKRITYVQCMNSRLHSI